MSEWTPIVHGVVCTAVTEAIDVLPATLATHRELAIALIEHGLLIALNAATIDGRTLTLAEFRSFAESILSTALSHVQTVVVEGAPS